MDFKYGEIAQILGGKHAHYVLWMAVPSERLHKGQQETAEFTSVQLWLVEVLIWVVGG